MQPSSTCWQKGQFKLCALQDEICAACAGFGIKRLFLNLASLEFLLCSSDTDADMHTNRTCSFWANFQICIPMSIFQLCLQFGFYNLIGWIIRKLYEIKQFIRLQDQYSPKAGAYIWNIFFTVKVWRMHSCEDALSCRHGPPSGHTCCPCNGRKSISSRDSCSMKIYDVSVHSLTSDLHLCPIL